MGLGIVELDGHWLVDEDGNLTDDLECCCDEGGCCDEVLPCSSGVVLEVEVISDTTGCFAVGTKIELNDNVSPCIWSSNGVPLAISWGGLYLACDTKGTPDQSDDELLLHWELGGCPEVDTSSDGFYTWTLISGDCDPFEWVYCYTLAEVSPPSGCPCLTGTVCVKVTIKP